MPIWKLTPTDKKSDHWKHSYYKDYVIVRASSENEAREITKAAFGVDVKRVTGGDILYDPWDQPDLVACELLEKSDYPEDGPAEILYPRL